MIDVARLGPWLDGAGLAGRGEPIEHRFVSGGTLNEIYEIRRGDLHCAMRIPPPSRSALLARYAEVSGRQVDDIDYYLILAKLQESPLFAQPTPPRSEVRKAAARRR